MRALNIRNVDEELFLRIKARAREERLFLHDWVVLALEDQLEARPVKRRRKSRVIPACPDDAKPMVWNEVTSSFQCPDCGYVLKPVE